ncbi:ESX-1 secretion-associated protein [Cellulomonas sp. DKR-3]|uniref:ESX-1 secretion-associated protein n=1 Tax=Cellulomonas fulva TaxID=2835530 RepID=A0ABS5TZ22_9CELL|nr:type VII secretion target [Cellulomonas fulva]MBT0994413.1 ESX-1 secretion-associated protein [Cellulomonas fulva]
MSGELEVVVDALRQEATTWDEQAQRLDAITSAAAALGMTGLQAGVFALMAGTTRDAAHRVGARCAEGRDVMGEVADALRTSATAYEQRDAAVADHVAGTY